MQTLHEDQIKGQVIDHLGLIAATIEKLGLIEKTNEMTPVSANKGSKVSMGHRLAAMILNGLGFIDDRLYLFPEFLANKPVERLLGEGLSAENFNDDALGRFLDAAYEYGVTKFFTEIAFKIGIENNLLGRSAHFDTSTLSVYGEYTEEESSMAGDPETNGKEKGPIKIGHGYSKANRPDLKQMVINLATTGAAGFPIWMEAHSGNASDKKIMIEAAKKMKDFCKQLKDAPDFLYVGDSALYENAVKCGGEMKWLSRVPEKIKEAKILTHRSDKEFTWKDQGNGYRTAAIESAYGGVKQRWVMVQSEQAFLRESRTLDKRISQEKKEMEKVVWHLSNQDFQCENDARKAANVAVKKMKYHGTEFKIITVKKHEKKGRPKKDALDFTTVHRIVGVLTEDNEKISLERRAKGRFILATNELDEEKLPELSILTEYKGQSKTESGFRFIKGNAFEVCSIFLKKPERIEALMMVMTLCLMVYSFAQQHLREALTKSGESLPNQMKKQTQNPTIAWIFRMFHGVQLLHITLPSMVQELVINLTETTKRIIRYFGVRAEYIYGLVESS